MKLSTAILKGSKGRKQTKESLIDSDDKVCALGAACYGVGIIPTVNLRKYFPILTQVTVKYLEDSNEEMTLEELIVEKNDRDSWSFKRIANWLHKFGF